MTNSTYTLRITKNGTKLATEDTSFRITPAQRDALHAWLAGVGSSPAPAQANTVSVTFRDPEPREMIDEPAVCDRCGQRFVSPTTGKLIADCYCGGTLVTVRDPGLSPAKIPHDDGAPIEFDYTNHRGRFARRRVMPLRIFYGFTEWHPERQWFLYGVDMDKGAHRSFPLAAILAPAAQPDTQRRLERMAKLISEFAGHLDGCACITSLGPCTCGFEAAWDAIESVAAAAPKEESNAE